LSKIINQAESEKFFSYYYLALCYKGKKDYKKSLEYCELGLKKPFLFFSFTNVELELYKIASENAKILGLTQKQYEYAAKFTEGASKINYQQKSEFMSKLYDINEVDPLVFDNNEKESKIDYLLLGLFSSMLIGSSILGFSLYKRAKDKKQFMKIIAELEAKALAPKLKINEEDFDKIKEKNNEEELSENIQSTPNTPILSKISNETEQMILAKLDDFERTEQFRNPDLSLITLASEFGTNINYISTIIKKYYNKSFSAYVNDLRIDYIIEKLRTDPAYLGYKISYLAEDCGYKSHSVFIRTFQQIKKINPSKFIDLLKKDKKDNYKQLFEFQN